MTTAAFTETNSTAQRPADAATDHHGRGWRIAPPGLRGARQAENRGRMWLLISFVLCPCHLPLTLALIATLAGGTAVGAALTASIWRLGVVMAVLYGLALWRGFHHLRQAQRACETEACEVSWRDVVQGHRQQG